MNPILVKKKGFDDVELAKNSLEHEEIESSKEKIDMAIKYLKATGKNRICGELIKLRGPNTIQIVILNG